MFQVMKLNSDAAIAQARRDIRRYGSLFNVVAAATRRADGVLVLPRETASDSAPKAQPSGDRPDLKR